MITEDYVSYETAKLLKEKGFDHICLMWYIDYYTTTIEEKTRKPVPPYLTSLTDEDGNYYHNTEREAFEYSAPTLQMAMKWLREVHNLSIEPYYYFILNWVVDIKYIGRRTDIREFEHIRDNNYNSYEEACEAAIKYCLENLI